MVAISELEVCTVMEGGCVILNVKQGVCGQCLGEMSRPV